MNAWCFSFIFQNFTDWFSVSQRCGTLNDLLEKGCARSRLEFPASKARILQDESLGRKTSDSNSTQIYPQKMALKLRPGTQHQAFWALDVGRKFLLLFRSKWGVLVFEQAASWPSRWRFNTLRTILWISTTSWTCQRPWSMIWRRSKTWAPHCLKRWPNSQVNFV